MLNGITVSLALIILGLYLIFGEFKSVSKIKSQKAEIVSETDFRRKTTQSESDTPSFLAILVAIIANAQAKICVAEMLLLF